MNAEHIVDGINITRNYSFDLIRQNLEYCTREITRPETNAETRDAMKLRILSALAEIEEIPPA